MKHQDLLGALVDELGMRLSNEQIHLLIMHLEWLLETNEVINLTSIRGTESALRLHVVDSLAALPDLEAAPGGSFLDLGTGGGFPGIPLHIASGRPVVLLDSVGKKAAALAAFAESLLPGAKVVSGRVETYSAEHRGAHSAVVARAVAQLPSLVELASPVLARGGLLIALKGQPSDEEIRLGDIVASKVGLARVARRRYVLPGGSEHRETVVYEKNAESAVQLPRRVGSAQKKPLAH